jgi:D-3-phosphoglycerate dehydrogenase
MFKVVIAESMAQDGILLLKYNPKFDVVVLDKNEKDKLKTELEDADALIVRSGVKCTAETLTWAKKIKIVGRAGAGYDNIDVKACSNQGIVVMNTPGGNSNGVVELTIGLMLALIRHIPKADSTMKQGEWAKNKLEGTELRGKTIGLVGLGRIGAQVGAICEAMGMKVIALVQNKNKKRSVPFNGQFVDDLNDLLPNVDFLSLHTPLNDKTRGMIGKEQLAAMKPGAFLINTARGAITDETALFEALKEKKIAGAAIDVYSEEPTSKDKISFIALDNVIALPHLGASTFESQANVSKVICENIIEALTNNVYLDAVNLPFAISVDDAAKYRPYIALAKRLGSFVGQWANRAVKEIKVTYRFTQMVDITPLSLTIAAEILKNSSPEVSLINIKDALQNKKINLVLVQSKKLQYDDSIKIVVDYQDGTQFEIRGVIIAGQVPKVVDIMNCQIEMVPAGHVLVYENKNVPGVVGAVGTLLGQEHVNISDIHLSQAAPGENVIACIMVDQLVSQSVLEKVKNINNVLDAKSMNFE